MKTLAVKIGLFIIAMNFIFWNIGPRETEIVERTTISDELSYTKAKSVLPENSTFLHGSKDGDTFSYYTEIVSIKTKSWIPMVYKKDFVIKSLKQKISKP